jgi:hypothetical protein
MTHLSDYSYLERGYTSLVVLIWALIKIYRTDKLDWYVLFTFHCFNTVSISKFFNQFLASPGKESAEVKQSPT